MSTSEQIRAAWEAALWESSTVTAITTQIHEYDLLQSPDATKEIDRMFYQGKINFFRFLVMRARNQDMVAGGTSSTLTYYYDVQVGYFIEKDIGKSAFNYNLAIDRLETIDGLIITELGKSWDSTVDYYEMVNAESPQLVTLAERSVWKASYLYRAFKTV